MDEAKRSAALAALEELPTHDGAIIGLGSGSTSRMFVEALGERVRAGLRVHGVPTSEPTRQLAEQVGIPLLDGDGPWAIDVTVDGADEVSQALDLIKGGGGAHTREKIVNYASARNVIIVDASKLSQRLGERWAIPLELLPFGHGATRAQLEQFGVATLRVRAGSPVRTDAGNLIYDLQTGPIDDPGILDRALHAIPGVVETGLFIARADVVLVAEHDGVRKLELGGGRLPSRAELHDRAKLR